ncbi:uncharacterized protein Dwil_GK25288 [Drosophila willistoni]|uniref:Chitin-binding type-2 domain-containing protein n=1 Tax=Drosophila willistoni TaxID=7260 RepID=B4N3Y2_DROWI|nr:neurogenic locus notch homolog protein 1 [Drosophila willistoni]EDW79337.2 uncharacterized protein Dwil_GK25288 [Drosophila willistoni]
MKPHYVLSLCLALSLFIGSLHAEDCCKDGETKADEDDCTQYYVCCTGQFVLKSCEDNYYWNATQGVCKEDNGECIGGNTNCEEGTIKENPSDCAGYLKCVNDDWVPVACAEGYYFHNGICTKDDDNVCLNCVEGCTKEDLDDCTKYRVCSNGKYVTKSCPTGDYWNAESRACERDEGQCNGNNSTCKDGTLQANPLDCAGYQKCENNEWLNISCPEGYYFNATYEACIFDTDGVCNGNNSTCVDGDKQINPSDCAGYQQCENNEWINKSCAEGTYFNATYKTCIVDTKGVCVNCVNGTKTSDEDNCAQYLECINGKYETKSCDVNYWWNGTDCTYDNGECNGNNSTCKDGTLQANPLDCAGYQQCENNEWINKSCAEGTYFNATYKTCIVDTKGVCVNCVNGTKTSDEDNCAQYLECINGKYETKSCDVNYWWNGTDCTYDNGECNGNNSTCKDGTLQANPLDCAGYQQCENNEWINKSCAEGTYFNATYKTCIVDTKGVCVNCVNGTKTSDEDNCAQYLECINGKYETKSCDVNDWWNGTDCTKDNGECNGNNSTCTEGSTIVDAANCAGYLLCNNNNWLTQKCPEGTYFNKTQCVYDRDGVCLNKTCDPECCDRPDNWEGPVDGNCSAFIQCVHGIMYEQRCANNLQYNPKKGECDYPYNVDCDDGSLPPSGPSAGPSGTYCESHGRCVGQRDGVMLTGVADTCGSTYIVCQCECEVELSCPSGLVFNPKYKVCDYEC